MIAFNLQMRPFLTLPLPMYDFAFSNILRYLKTEMWYMLLIQNGIQWFEKVYFCVGTLVLPSVYELFHLLSYKAEFLLANNSYQTECNHIHAYILFLNLAWLYYWETNEFISNLRELTMNPTGEIVWAFWSLLNEYRTP